MRIGIAVAMLAQSLMLTVSAAMAQPVLSIDFDAKTTDPQGPIFNRKLGESVVVSVKAKDMTDFVATIDVPSYTPGQGDDGVKEDNFFVNIRSCAPDKTLRGTIL